MSKKPSEFEVTEESGNVFADLGLENAEEPKAAAEKISDDKLSDEGLVFFNLEKWPVSLQRKK